MLVNTYNQNGKLVGQSRLPPEIFKIKINSDLVHQVVISQLANRRKMIAQSKTRGEVRGGGRKPWRQKGTGRARHGSIRSPLWQGGGVTFGPRTEKVFKKKIPNKMRRKALYMVLSGKVKAKLLIVLDKLKIEQPKTKLMTEILNKLPCKEKKALIVLSEYDQNIIMAARNLPQVDTLWASNINALDLLSFKYLVMPKESIKVIKETFMGENSKQKIGNWDAQPGQK